MFLLTGPEQAWRFDFCKGTTSSDAERFMISGTTAIYTDDVAVSDAAGAEDRDGLSHTAATAFTVWDCAIVLAKHLESRGSLAGKRVVELGAGKGIAGIAAALLGGIVTLTDVAEATAQLQRIADLNQLLGQRDHRVGYVKEVIALDWNVYEEPVRLIKEGGDVDLIIASDVVWVNELIPALCRTIRALMSPTTKMLLAHQTRSHRGDKLLKSELTRNGLLFTEIYDLGIDAHFMRNDVTVFLITLQPASV